MKISILAFDLSNNALGRTYVLAKVLRRRYEVEITGPVFGDSVWPPLENEFDFRMMPGHTFKEFVRLLPKSLNTIGGHVVYAHKPLFTSFGVGLLERVLSMKPLILDIDDWEMGFIRWEQEMRRYSVYEKTRDLVLGFSRPNSYTYVSLLERLSRFATDITVSNAFLKRRFGGTLVPHGRDTESLDPGKVDRSYVREKFSVSDKRVITFLGTPRPYKGIEDLIDAVSLLNSPSVLLMVIGLGEDSYSRRLAGLALEKLGEHHVRLLSQQPFKRVPEFLALSDLVVVPQHRNQATIGQVPAKVFDAMAMAKPIIATRVSDLPEILEGCGWTVEPENPERLAEAIEYIFENPGEAIDKGRRAREKCIDRYSWNALGRILDDVFSRYE